MNGCGCEPKYMKRSAPPGPGGTGGGPAAFSGTKKASSNKPGKVIPWKGNPKEPPKLAAHYG